MKALKLAEEILEFLKSRKADHHDKMAAMEIAATAFASEPEQIA